MLAISVGRRRFLDGLGDALPRPRAIVVASAHFTTDRPMLGGHPQPHTVHDFGGFPEPLYHFSAARLRTGEDIAARLAAAGWR
jgi:4,5-DOPA dioxygenase extradiol